MNIWVKGLKYLLIQCLILTAHLMASILIVLAMMTPLKLMKIMARCIMLHRKLNSLLKWLMREAPITELITFLFQWDVIFSTLMLK